jgi:hypothetical protein
LDQMCEFHPSSNTNPPRSPSSSLLSSLPSSLLHRILHQATLERVPPIQPLDFWESPMLCCWTGSRARPLGCLASPVLLHQALTLPLNSAPSNLRIPTVGQIGHLQNGPTNENDGGGE